MSKLIWSGDKRASFFKPEIPGESVEGKVLGVRKSQFRDVVRLLTADLDLVDVPINSFLADVPWSSLQDQVVKIEFEGWKEVQGGKLRTFKVYIIDDEVPF